MSGSRERRWTAADVPDLSGRTAVVTGASAGLGLETARVLTARGARVVLACRDLGRAARAATAILADAGRAGTSRAAGAGRADPVPPEVVRLDLASLASVRESAARIREACPRLDLLVNNAGVMEVPDERTEDGFELTLATNHLGHFALTGLVLDRLLTTPGSRVVTVSSMAHLDGVMNFDDLQAERGYRPDTAYGQSKLANLLFTYELDRRLRAAGAPTIALAAHPGVVYTSLFRTRSRLNRAFLSPGMRVINFWAVQNAAMGALPTLRAATDPAARGGEYYGPRRRFYTLYTGYPGRVGSSARSHDVADQARLWRASELLTGVGYEIRVPPALR